MSVSISFGLPWSRVNVISEIEYEKEETSKILRGRRGDYTSYADNSTCNQ